MTHFNDARVAGRMRTRGGYRLVRGFGRGLTVRRRKAAGESALLLGMGLIGVGVIGCAMAFFTNVQLAGGAPVVLMLAGGQMLVLGTGLVCYHRLMERTTANEQALRFQYDLGYEDGYQERDKTARPVLVDMDAHRCHHDQALTRI